MAVARFPMYNQGVTSTPWYDQRTGRPMCSPWTFMFYYLTECRLCQLIFFHSSIVCEHLKFCGPCLDEHGLGHGMRLFCPLCSGTSVSGNQQMESQQEVLYLMHMIAKYKKTYCGNPAVNSLCQQLNEVININESTSSNTPSLPCTFQGGTKPCLGPGCKTCTLVEATSSVTGPSGNTWCVDGNFTCRSKCVIYYINCKRCQKGYVGKTKQKLHDRMSQHCRDIQRNARSSVANHFNLPFHTMEDFKVSVIQSFYPNTSDRTILKEEKRIMLHLGTIEPHGMNKG